MAPNKEMRKKRKEKASTGSNHPSVASPEPEALTVVLKRLEEMEEKLAMERKEKHQLEHLIEELRADKNSELDTLSEDAVKPIPRPVGTCGKDWSLQVEMGLATSSKNKEKYKALLRGMRDLVLNANIKWEVGWREITPGDKNKMFQVARERYPILKRYMNDWATAEIAKQYIKNKRAHHYKNGWLEVPEKYAYLKANASKRDPSASRIKRAKAVMAAKKKAKQVAALSSKRRHNMEEEEEEQSTDNDMGEDVDSENEGSE